MPSEDVTVRITLKEDAIRKSYEELSEDMRYYRERGERGYGNEYGHGQNVPPSWEEYLESYLQIAKDELLNDADASHAFSWEIVE